MEETKEIIGPGWTAFDLGGKNRLGIIVEDQGESWVVHDGVNGEFQIHKSQVVLAAPTPPLTRDSHPEAFFGKWLFQGLFAGLCALSLVPWLSIQNLFPVLDLTMNGLFAYMFFRGQYPGRQALAGWSIIVIMLNFLTLFRGGLNGWEQFGVFALILARAGIVGTFLVNQKIRAFIEFRAGE